MTGLSISGQRLLTGMMFEKKVMIIQKSQMHGVSISGQELLTVMIWNPFFLRRQKSIFNAVEFIYLAMIFSFSG